MYTGIIAEGRWEHLPWCLSSFRNIKNRFWDKGCQQIIINESPSFKGVDGHHHHCNNTVKVGFDKKKANTLINVFTGPKWRCGFKLHHNISFKSFLLPEPPQGVPQKT